jgi:hypothetical protein
MKLFYKVEFDPSFYGGDYKDVGNFVLIPADLVDQVGMDKAFEKTTGHVAANIVHYSESEMYCADGELYVGDEPEATPTSSPSDSEPVPEEK